MRNLAIASLLMLLACVAQAGTVVITSKPRGAAVMEEDKQIGTTPCRLNMEAGKHRIVLQHAGCDDLERVFAVGVKPVILQLELLPKTYPVIIVWEKDEPDLDDHWFAFVDGKVIYDGSKQPYRLPSTLMLQKGMHLLSACRSGYRDIHKRIKVLGEDGGQVIELPVPKKGASVLDGTQLTGDYWRCGHTHEIVKLRKGGGGVIDDNRVSRKLKWTLDSQTLTLTLKWGLETVVLVQDEDGAWRGEWVNRGGIRWGMLRSPFPIKKRK
jgi:hypothetical protein